MPKFISGWLNKYFSDPEAITIIVLLAASILVLKTMGYILAPIIAGIVIAYLLSGIVTQLEKYRCPHLLAVFIVFLIFITSFLLVFLWIVPKLWQEMVNLFNAIPNMIAHGQAFFSGLQDRYPNLISPDQVQQLIISSSSYAANLGKAMVTFSLASLMNVIVFIVYLVLIPLLVFFFLRDQKPIANWIKQFMPKKRHVISTVWREVDSKIGSYIRGRIVEIILVSLVTSLLFAVMGLNYSILLGVLVGCSVVIPYIGIVIVTFPIVVVAFMQWGFAPHFFYLLLSYAIIALLDANVLVPMLFAEAMDLHPVAIILSIVIFGFLGGFWGVFFAIPLVFLGSHFFSEKPLIQRLMDEKISLPQQIWNRINGSWVVFFTVMGITNLYIAYHFNTDVWVNFKLFGLLGATILFGVAQSFYMALMSNDKISEN